MINNRQAGRRNRGRNNNNGRPSGGNRGGGDNGNRIDNRARGNATQLLEKYKNMARDAQMTGDRVNAEYYLQFADHYFRVLADNRARQEEQQQQNPRFRRPDDNFDFDGDDFDASDDGGEESREQQQPQQRTFEGDRRREEPRNQRDDRDGNQRRDRNRRDRPAFNEAHGQSEADFAATRDAPVIDNVREPQVEEAHEAPRPRRGRPRKVEADRSEGAEGLDLAVLPPSIARADNDSESAAEEAPRKRTRRPRPAAEAAE
ncbi:MAG TPA: DUF4167 domain-containing protein [Sphingobium sp.]